MTPVRPTSLVVADEIVPAVEDNDEQENGHENGDGARSCTDDGKAIAGTDRSTSDKTTGSDQNDQPASSLNSERSPLLPAV